MAQPKLPRCRRKLPSAAPRKMDLLGIGKDGSLYLWEFAAMVQPVSAFERRGSGIISGHYVILRQGKAITVHCGNMSDGRVSVQYMCGGVPTCYLDRKTVEGILLGRVIPDPVLAAEILAKLQDLTEREIARQTAPHRKRGSL